MRSVYQIAKPVEPIPNFLEYAIKRVLEQKVLVSEVKPSKV